MKIDKRTLAIPIILIISLIMSGCQPGQLMGPTITPSPTDTPLPTFTQTNTSTSTPTLTPNPTITPTPTIEPPSQLATFFDDTSITYFDGFDSFRSEQWQTPGCATTNNGILEYSCKNGYINQTNPLYDGEGIMIDISAPRQDDWTIYYYTSSYGKDEFRTFGYMKDKGYGKVNLMRRNRICGID
jgi:hypothetical protein